VVVEIFIAQGQAEDPLPEQLLDGMLDQLFITMVGKTLGQLANDARVLLNFSQQQPPRIGGDRSAIKAGHHLPPTKALETKRLLGTLCLHRLSPCYWHKCASQTYLCQRRQPIAIAVVRIAG
jgi:hypothetical protein